LKRSVKYKDYPIMTCYMSTWFPLFGQGLCLGSIAFVRYVFYKDTKVISTPDTEDVVKHEYAHYLQGYFYGWTRYYLIAIRDYTRFWIKHDDKPIEIEANRLKGLL